jgi:hypothetical protein
MNKSTFGFIIVVILVFVGFVNVGSADAMTSGNDMRADACRTFHTFSHQKAEDTRQEIDGLFCGMPEVKEESKDNDNPVITTVIITIPELPIDSSVPTTPDESTDSDNSTPVIEDTPVIEEQENTGNGNPGNIKDVGNAGENPNGNGTMPNDNAGGNGNGEHGNQGENGNSGNK